MKYSVEDIKPILDGYGYKIIELINSKAIISIDKDGYKYKINL